MQRLFILVTLLTACAAQAQTGNVGIGTAAPSEKLQVAGNIKADTLKPNAFQLAPNAAAGKVLTSDAMGNASWQAANSSISTTGTSGSIGYGPWGDCATNANVSEYQPIADFSGPNGKNLGYSTAIQGNWALAGAPLDSNFKGTAHLYQFDGTQWVLKQKLTDPDGKQGDRFGYAVCFSGNFAFVGAPEDSVSGGTGDGSFCVFKFNGTNWVFLQKLTDPGAGPTCKLGSSLSASGNWAVAGLPGRQIGSNTSQGVANLYQFDGSFWVIKQTVYNAAGVDYGLFGNSVSVSNNWMFIGNSGDTSNNNPRGGSVFIYKLNGNNWQQTQRLFDMNESDLQFFGSSVSASDGYAIIGAKGSYSSGQSISGAVFFYKYDGTSWVKTQAQTNTYTGSTNGLGNNVCISGKYALAGSVPYSSTGQSVIIFNRVGDVWVRLQLLTDPTGDNTDGFGGATAIDGTTKRFCIGAFRAYMLGDYGGGTINRGKIAFGKLN